MTEPADLTVTLNAPANHVLDGSPRNRLRGEALVLTQPQFLTPLGDRG
jgi:hypothetical protein